MHRAEWFCREMVPEVWFPGTTASESSQNRSKCRFQARTSAVLNHKSWERGSLDLHCSKLFRCFWCTLTFENCVCREHWHQYHMSHQTNHLRPIFYKRPFITKSVFRTIPQLTFTWRLSKPVLITTIFILFYLLKKFTLVTVEEDNRGKKN